MNPSELKASFDDLLSYKSIDEEIEHNAQMLAFSFLSIIDAEMEKQSISKKKLAELIGTSPSFITQLFRGDRNPNWIMLAKMQKALGLDFKITTEYSIEKRITEAISDAHKTWINDGCYVTNYVKLIGQFELQPNNEDYALAS